MPKSIGSISKTLLSRLSKVEPEPVVYRCPACKDLGGEERAGRWHKCPKCKGKTLQDYLNEEHRPTDKPEHTGTSGKEDF